MPLYDYKCRACSTVTEVRHDFRAPYEGKCPACGGELARVFHPAGVLFKGSGFYLTDSRKQASDAAAASSKSASKPSDAAAKAADASTTPASSAPAAAPAPAADSAPKKSDASAA
jgi:putative FmdB family regulatory protein